MPAATRRGSTAAARQTIPVTFEASYAAFTGTQSFATSCAASGSLDLSAHAGKSGLVLLLNVGFFANGGGNITNSVTFNGVALTPISGAVQDRTAGNNAGAQLWYMQNPPTTGPLTISATVTGTANTGRCMWIAPSVYSHVGSIDGGVNALSLASGAVLTVSDGVGTYCVNAMALASTSGLAAYNQTIRQGPTSVGGVSRFICGDAVGDGAGTKDFSTTGASYNSVGARLRPA